MRGRDCGLLSGLVALLEANLLAWELEEDARIRSIPLSHLAQFYSPDITYDLSRYVRAVRNNSHRQHALAWFLQHGLYVPAYTGQNLFTDVSSSPKVKAPGLRLDEDYPRATRVVALKHDSLDILPRFFACLDDVTVLARWKSLRDRYIAAASTYRLFLTRLASDSGPVHKLTATGSFPKFVVVPLIGGCTLACTELPVNTQVDDPDISVDLAAFAASSIEYTLGTLFPLRAPDKAHMGYGYRLALHCTIILFYLWSLLAFQYYLTSPTGH